MNWPESENFGGVAALSGGAGALGGGSGTAGESDREQRATLGLVAAGNLASMILDYSVDSAESEAGAFADWLGRVKGIEDALRIAQPRTGVGKLQ